MDWESRQRKGTESIGFGREGKDSDATTRRIQETEEAEDGSGKGPGERSIDQGRAEERKGGTINGVSLEGNKR